MADAAGVIPALAWMMVSVPVFLWQRSKPALRQVTGRSTAAAPFALNHPVLSKASSCFVVLRKPSLLLFLFYNRGRHSGGCEGCWECVFALLFVDGMQTVRCVTGCWLRGAWPQAFDTLPLLCSSVFSLPLCCVSVLPSSSVLIHFLLFPFFFFLHF